MLQRVVNFKTLTAILLTALPAMAAGGSRPPSPTCAYAGEAVVADAKVLGLNVALSDTSALPSSGGSLSAQLLNANVPGLLSLQLLNANTVGGNSKTDSQASVANVSVTAAGISITASVLTSNATAEACENTPSVAGNSVIADLKVNGISVTVTGAPNQTINLLVGSLVINEQSSTVTNANGVTSADMVVNALHLRVLGIADVVISSSHAGVCGGSNCKP